MYSHQLNPNDAKQTSVGKLNQSDIFDRFKKSSSTNFNPNHDR